MRILILVVVSMFFVSCENTSITDSINLRVCHIQKVRNYDDICRYYLYCYESSGKIVGSDEVYRHFDAKCGVLEVGESLNDKLRCELSKNQKQVIEDKKRKEKELMRIDSLNNDRRRMADSLLNLIENVQ